MSHKPWLVSVFLVILAAPNAPDSRAQMRGAGRETLQGLTEVALLLRTTPERMGEPDQPRLPADIEQKLQKVGVRVVRGVGKPILFFQVKTAKNDKGFLAYSVELELLQIATLKRPPDMVTFASTWSEARTGITDAANSHVVNETMDSILDNFIADYLVANPKRTGEIKR